jgi:DNA polymerase III delta subunit
MKFVAIKEHHLYNKAYRQGNRFVGRIIAVYVLRDYAAKKLMSSARRFSPRFFETASSLVLETDYQIKTSQDDPQRLLETLILQLSQEARK